LIFLDTSVLIGAAQTTHVRYEASRKLVSEAQRSTTACALHTLAETYASLSGMPRPYKLPPQAALRVIEQARERMQTVTLTEKEYMAAIEAAAGAGLSGGILYDALIMQCARKVSASHIYSWNARHFKLIAPDLASRIYSP
jgi:predicted nucleic acid-binding protein